jgi:3-oxoacyl-[acyl-carrier protein] reductase
VNLSSIAAFGNRGQANYSAAKAGLMGFTRTLGTELGRFGITVNAIAPGFIETDMTVAAARRLGVTFEEFQTTIAQRTPVGRVGVPADIAAAVSYFVSDEASFVTGQTLCVSGGLP